ncbi:hypothetical protein Tco_0256238 [Tanacetum coccineum]
MILSGADNRPPMLDKDLYDSWKSRMELYMQNRENRRMILESVEHGPLIWPTIKENGVTRTKKYAKLSAAEKIQADCDMKATNIILQGESLHKYYLRFTQLINDMNIYNMKMEQFQVNTKFLNNLPPEWSKFMTDVKLVKDLHTTNFDQLHAYLEQHELHANEVRLAVMVFSPGDDPIACLNKSMAFLIAVASSRGDKVKVILVLVIRVMLLVLGETMQVDMQGLLNAKTVKVPDGQDVQTIIQNNAAFQTEDLETYDSDCDDISNAKVVLMANISNYGSDVISEEKANKEQNNESVTVELEIYKERVKTFEQRLNIDLSSREKMIDSQMDDMIKEKLALKEQVDSLKQNISKQIKEAFYDNAHKQALGYQNPFYLKKAQRIKPTLYDGIVISDKHVAISVIDDEETLILEEESRSKMSKNGKDSKAIKQNISKT